MVADRFSCSVLHPAICVRYFENTDLWAPEVAIRAQQLLEDTYAEYADAAKSATSTAVPPEQTPAKPQASRSSVFGAAIGSGKATSGSPSDSTETAHQGPSEVEIYCSNAYPCTDENGSLPWWKVHVHRPAMSTVTNPYVQMHGCNLPILARAARDVLAVPGVSIGVERLFSSCRHTLTDSRSSLTAVSAALTVITKEWMKRGWGDNIAYLTGMSIHH